jgi:large subunit ribosomal protein L23
MMAIFGRKKNTEKKEKKKPEIQAKKSEKLAPIRVGRSVEHILLRQRVTEKATDKSLNEGVYVFEVDRRSNKKDVREAVSIIYKVYPRKIAIVNTPRKKIFVRGKWGVRPGSKKAYVYLKDGDKIEIV